MQWHRQAVPFFKTVSRCRLTGLPRLVLMCVEDGSAEINDGIGQIKPIAPRHVSGFGGRVVLGG